MKSLFAIIAITFGIVSCSSSGPAPETKEVKVSAPASALEKTSTPSKSAAPAPAKPMKCAYDTDCMVQNSCVNEKCKLTGNECRFRSDCPSPRGTCINKVCEFR